MSTAETAAQHDVAGDSLEPSAANREQTVAFSRYTALLTPARDNVTYLQLLRITTFHALISSGKYNH